MPALRTDRALRSGQNLDLHFAFSLLCSHIDCTYIDGQSGAWGVCAVFDWRVQRRVPTSVTEITAAPRCIEYANFRDPINTIWLFTVLVMRWSKEREMHAMRETYRFRPWCDWLLLAAGLVALCMPLDLVADAVYRSDHTVLYWWLIAYSYPDGTPFATVVGLFILVLTLLAYWISLRLLARSGWGVSREREPGTPRLLSTLLRQLALIVVATLLAVTIAPAALFTGKQSIDYRHLAGADFQAHRYYLAREQSPSDGSRVLLYSCDALGVWCHEVDTLRNTGNGPDGGGWPRYDPATQTITASKGDHIILTYPAGTLFEGA